MSDIDRMFDQAEARAARGGCRLPCYDPWHHHGPENEDFKRWEEEADE